MKEPYLKCRATKCDTFLSIGSPDWCPTHNNLNKFNKQRVDAKDKKKEKEWIKMVIHNDRVKEFTKLRKGFPPMTLRMIGEKYGLSAGGVSFILKKGIKYWDSNKI